MNNDFIIIMKLVETIQLQKNQELSDLCHKSKNLYNLGLYYINEYKKFIENAEYFIKLDKKVQNDFKKLFQRKREIYYKKGKRKKQRCPKYLNGNDLKWILKWHPIWKQFKGFTQVAQNTLLRLSKNIDNNFKAIKDGKKHPDKYLGKRNLSDFLRKDGEWMAIFNAIHLSIKNNKLNFPKTTKITPIEINTTKDELRETTITPKNDIYNLNVGYEIKEYDLNLDKERMIAIDIGVNNLACIVNNIGLQPISINGKPLKSINHYYNKQMAKYQSILKTENDNFESKKIQKLRRIRNNKVTDYMHKASRYIINYCIENNIGTIIIGKNDGWKQKINMGKPNNQNFVQIPFNILIEKLQYKADLIGIDIITTTEEYTSQTCCKCGIIKKSNRKYRGLYVCSECGTKINADVNGSYNIMKKAFPKMINMDGIQGVRLHPLLINLDTKSRSMSMKTSQTRRNLE